MRIKDRLKNATKEYTRKRIIWAVIIAVVFALLTAPSVATNAYHSAIAAHVSESQAEGRAFLTVCLLLAGWLFMAGWFLFIYVGFLLPMCRDIASAFRWLSVNLPRVRQWPARARRAIASAAAAIGGFFSSISAAMRKGKAAVKADPGGFVFMTVCFAIMGTLMYFGWPTASHLVSKLPHWMQDDTFPLKLAVDLIGSGFVFIIVMAFLTPVLKPILKWLSKPAK